MGNVEKKQSIDEIVGSNVKAFRDVNGINRKELADNFHISDDALYRIEKGETGLSSEYAYILANKFGCDMNFIYSSKDITEFIPEKMKDTVNAGNKKDAYKMAVELLRYAAQVIEEKTDI